MAAKRRKWWGPFTKPARKYREQALPEGWRKVGPMLGLLGFLSRRSPYFRGKGRLTEKIFHRWTKRKRLVQIVRLTRNLRMKCKLWDEVQHNIWWLGPRYELKETRFFRRYLKSGMVFFDIGANVGYYSLLASDIIDDGSIHSFEPIFEQYRDLLENVERNELTNVTVNRLIVSNRSGSLDIHLGSEDNSGSASVEFVYREADVGKETVECTTLDEYVRVHKVKQIDVVKIDTEGHETSVLQGAQDTLKKFKPLLLIEVRGKMLEEIGSSRDKFFQQMKDLGYQAYELKRNGRPVKMLKPADGNLVVFSAIELRG